MAPDAARSVPNAARLVRDAAAIGARWCEIARDAARSVRDGVRSVRVLCVGSRNLHRHTHHTSLALTVYKIWPWLRLRAVPGGVVGGRGGQTAA